jgi:hypothetical protein
MEKPKLIHVQAKHSAKKSMGSNKKEITFFRANMVPKKV